MVSSKCCQVESPSPLRFFAALMPPCAQTECERFTGTIENRSTWPPVSAILMTAARPASPPPTTMIFGAAAMSVHRLSGAGAPMNRLCDVALRRGLLEPGAEGVEAGEPDDAHHEEEHQAQAQQAALCPVSSNDAPF